MPQLESATAPTARRARTRATRMGRLAARCVRQPPIPCPRALSTAHSARLADSVRRVLMAAPRAPIVRRALSTATMGRRRVRRACRAIISRRQNKAHAWNAFQKLNPDEVLFARILIALNAQVNHYQELQAAGLWVPHWRYPANWLTQRGWEDDINTNKLQEKPNAAHKARTTKQPVDFFWESCKGGADYIPDSETIVDDGGQSSGNVIQFSERRKASEAY